MMILTRIAHNIVTYWTDLDNTYNILLLCTICTRRTIRTIIMYNVAHGIVIIGVHGIVIILYMVLLLVLLLLLLTIYIAILPRHIVHNVHIGHIVQSNNILYVLSNIAIIIAMDQIADGQADS